MSTVPEITPAGAEVPELSFAVEAAGPLHPAAVPTLKLALRIDALGGRAVRSILLDIQIQIAARRRAYDEAAQQRLAECVISRVCGLHADTGVCVCVGSIA